MQRGQSVGMIDIALLILAAALWIGLHVGVSGTWLRDAALARLGTAGRFMLVFSAGSVVSVTLLVMAWQNAPFIQLWEVPDWLRWLIALAMLPALILFVASVTKPNPTAMGGKLDGMPRGITRVTRHPMLWSFAIWAAGHVLGNGDLASLIFFGAFLLTAGLGMPSIDSKIAKRDPELWAKLAPGTSIMPFGAIFSGRMTADFHEIGWVPPVVGGLAWVALLMFHRLVFGVPAVL